MQGWRIRGTSPLAVALLAALAAGCHSVPWGKQPFEPPAVPKELNKATLPEYRVEPPDILLIEAVRAIPKPPYKAEPLDVLFIDLADPPFKNPNTQEPIPLTGEVTVDPDGTIEFGQPYGKVAVNGMTTDEAKAAIEKHLAKTLQKPTAEVTLAESRGQQQIRGPHLVRQDGTIGLGQYGSV